MGNIGSYEDTTSAWRKASREKTAATGEMQPAPAAGSPLNYDAEEQSDGES